MITFLSSPKAFTGKVGENQVRAIKSWLRIHPDIEILLYGRSKNADIICKQFDIKYSMYSQAAESGALQVN